MSVIIKDYLIIASYAIISIISTLLLLCVFYILFHKTPKEMKVYSWLLINVQIWTYVEVTYWAALMTPIPEAVPIPHFYFISILYKIFGTSGKSIETFLHCLVISALQIAIGYRYKQLCAFGDRWYHRLTAKSSYRNDVINLYFIFPAVFTFCTYIGLTTDEETRSLILKLDPNHVFPFVVSTFSDQAYWWALFLLLSAVAGIFGPMFLVCDTDRILRMNANSSRTAALHKEAIVALITQMALMEATSLIGSTILAIVHFICRNYKILDNNSLFDLFISIAVCFFSIKSICCSLAIILVHKPYRLAAKRIFFKGGENVVMVQHASNSSSL